ncbi:MAG: M16 family metallopeptidase, partial [Sphingomonadaceae bacterium]
LLERKGLSFGADTNASTGFDATVYKLDLPQNSPDLLDTALMLMRETASELTLAEDAVERERGVLLAEMRDRRTYQLKNLEDQIAFITPGARYANRLPFGTEDVLKQASAEDIRGYYTREYVPTNTVLVVIGDYDPHMVETEIRRYFSSWKAAPRPAPATAGPVDIMAQGQSDIYLDPSLPERIRIARNLAWDGRVTNTAQWRQKLLSRIGYAIINRRLAALAREADPPFKGAGFGTSDVFEDGRTTSLVIDTVAGGWKRGMEASVPVWHAGITHGFTESEVAEEMARLRTAYENAAAGEQTRSNRALFNEVTGWLEDGTIAESPSDRLMRFENFTPSVTPAAVLTALRQDSSALTAPLIRFEGKGAPEGGRDALRSVWEEAMAIPVSPPEIRDIPVFGYTDFGPAGKITTDRVDARLGIREIRFSNGVRLNLKPTNLRADRISFRLSLDGGNLLNTVENPLETTLVPMLPAGGLGKHSLDELTTILAGHTASLNVSNGTDDFLMSGTTTPRDLELQLQLLAAGLTDPGYRREGEVRFYRSLPDYFARMNATATSALSSNISAILSDNDPRFTIASQPDYEALTFAAMQPLVGDRLKNGAIEIGLVGDFDEAKAIDLVARTLGTLPEREPEFLPREAARERKFTPDRSQRTLYHDGESDTSLVYYVWPTADNRSQKETVHMSVLERVINLSLMESLREGLGMAYSPSVNSSMSQNWRDYGTFSISVSVRPDEIGKTENAINTIIENMRTQPVSADLLSRATRPLIEGYDNALKSNPGWLSLVDRAQSESDRIDRYKSTRAILETVSAGDLASLAQKYLVPGQAVIVHVLPRPESDRKQAGQTVVSTTD